jgi:hypothetical protein
MGTRAYIRGSSVFPAIPKGKNMPRRAHKRNEAPQSKHVRGAMSLGKARKRSAKDDESLEELFGVEPFHRNEISIAEINRLRS